VDKELFAPPEKASTAAGRIGQGAGAGRKVAEPAPVGALSFEQAYARLEEIVAEMERGGAGLDRLLDLFEEGVGLSRLCGGYLKQAQLRVERFIEQRDGQWVLKDLDPENRSGEAV
jgi:exodeoxyribonuclease VII small subunit